MSLVPSPATSGTTSKSCSAGLHWRAERDPGRVREPRLPGTPAADGDARTTCCADARSPTSANAARPASRPATSPTSCASEANAIGAEEVARQYVYVTAGSCGACRFGQYHQSYELALRNLGLESFRMFLMAQDRARPGRGRRRRARDQPAVHASAWSGRSCAPTCCRTSNTRRGPYEVTPGADRPRVREERRLSLRRLPQAAATAGKKWGALAWHLTTDYFVKALREVLPPLRRDRGRPAARQAGGEDHRRVLSADRRGRPQLQHPPLARGGRGARSIRPPIAVWLDYLDAVHVQEFEDHVGIDRYARAEARGRPHAAGAAAAGPTTGCARALGDVPHELPDQYELRRLAAPYFHSRLSGGEGDMLVGKALWAHLHKKAHMICELSPYCLHAEHHEHRRHGGVIGKHPDLLYAPLEIKGDAEVHALSRCQMILTEAKKRAQREFEEALERDRPHDRAARALARRDTADEARRPTACRTTAWPAPRRISSLHLARAGSGA